MAGKDVYDLIEKKYDRRWKREELIVDADRFKTYDEVFDRQNLDHIYKLMTRGEVKRLMCPVSTGKEANVYEAVTGEGEKRAVKIFRTSTSTFRSFLRYIEGDRRFKSIDRSHRGIINTWTRKEYMNLKALSGCGLRVPLPRAYHRNVLVMDYIGYEGKPAPQIRVLDAERAEWEEMWAEVLDFIERAYLDCDLVHADLSEYNILYDGRPVFIDVGQTIHREHPMAGELLQRDLGIISSFFEKRGMGDAKADARSLGSELLAISEDDGED